MSSTDSSLGATRFKVLLPPYHHVLRAAALAFVAFEVITRGVWSIGTLISLIPIVAIEIFQLLAPSPYIELGPAQLEMHFGFFTRRLSYMDIESADVNHSDMVDLAYRIPAGFWPARTRHMKLRVEYTDLFVTELKQRMP